MQFRTMITFEMNVLERPNDRDEALPPAFESDQKALALWDAIISTIRLRPGAVD